MITSFAIPILQSFRRAPLILCLCPDEDEEDLFLGQGGPRSEWEIHAIVKKSAFQAQQEDVTAHTLRHSFAKNLVDAGAPLD